MAFFKKTSHPKEKNDSIAKKNIKRMDTVVTGMILGGVIASIYGVKKLNEKVHQDAVDDIHDNEHPEEKRGIWKRIFLGNK